MWKKVRERESGRDFTGAIAPLFKYPDSDLHHSSGFPRSLAPFTFVSLTMSDFKSRSEDFIKGDVTPRQDVYVQKSNDDIFEDGTVNPVYQAKARLLNAAIQEIGMGRYQARVLSARDETSNERSRCSGISSLSQASAGSRTSYLTSIQTAYADIYMSTETVFGR